MQGRPSASAKPYGLTQQHWLARMTEAADKELALSQSRSTPASSHAAATPEGGARHRRAARPQSAQPPIRDKLAMYRAATVGRGYTPPRTAESVSSSQRRRPSSAHQLSNARVDVDVGCGGVPVAATLGEAVQQQVGVINAQRATATSSDDSRSSVASSFSHGSRRRARPQSAAAAVHASSRLTVNEPAHARPQRVLQRVGSIGMMELSLDKKERTHQLEERQRMLRERMKALEEGTAREIARFVRRADGGLLLAPRKERKAMDPTFLASIL